MDTLLDTSLMQSLSILIGSELGFCNLGSFQRHCLHCDKLCLILKLCCVVALMQACSAGASDGFVSAALLLPFPVLYRRGLPHICPVSVSGKVISLC